MIDSSNSTSPSRSPSSERDAQSVLLRLPLNHFDDARQHRAFTYFVECTAPELTGNFAAGFWQHVLLQASVTEPALRHGVVAIASIHEGFTVISQDARNLDARNKAYTYALTQYSRAVESLKGLISHQADSLESILFCCALLVCFDSFRGNYAAASVHLKAGLNIMSSRRGPLATKNGMETSTPLDSQVIQLFTRIGVQISIFIESHFPDNTNELCEKIYIMNSDQGPCKFTNIDEAQHCLCIITNTYMLIFNKFANGFPTELVDDDSPMKLLQNLSTWSACFNAMLQRLDPSKLSSKAVRASALLKLQHLALTVMATAALSSDNTAESVSSFESEYSTIISLSTSLVAAGSTSKSAMISSDLGIIAPLYVTLSRCTILQLRLEALKLLEAAPRREGMWDAEVAAKIASSVLAIEERNRKIEEERLKSENGNETLMKLEQVRFKSSETETGDTILAVDVDFRVCDVKTGQEMIVTERIITG